MKGMSKAAEKQSMDIHEHPMRPVPSLRWELQTLQGVGNRIETSPGLGEKGPREEQSAAKLGKGRPVELGLAVYIHRKGRLVKLGLAVHVHWTMSIWKTGHYVLFIPVAWFTEGAHIHLKP